MTQTCTDADTHNDTELHYLFNYPHIIPELHAYTHRRVLYAHRHAFAHIFLLPCNQSLTQIQLPVFPWRSQSFSHATPWCCSEGDAFHLCLSLPSLFISEEIIREWAKTRKKTTTCKLQKKRHRKGSARGEERQCFFKVCGFWLFSWPIEPHCALSPQTLRISNGCFLTQSKQIAWKRTNRWEGESGKGRDGGCR